MRYLQSTQPHQLHLYFLLAAVALIVSTRPTSAQVTYSGTALYLLAPPSGFPTSNIFATGGGQAVGDINQMSGAYVTQEDAALWSPPTGTVTDLSPAGANSSVARAVFGTQQAGSADFSTGYNAILWSGTAASAVDLQTPGYLGTQAVGLDGNNQVGSGSVQSGPGPEDQIDHALLWTGTAASVVDLNPPGKFASEANGVGGNQEVGVVYIVSGYSNIGLPNAVLWYGTAQSAVNLSPAGFQISHAYATNGTQQVGSGEPAPVDFDHAFLWSDTAASAIDLTPTGFQSADAYGLNATQQVGMGGDTAAMGRNHALLWSGTAASAIDLQPLLPSTGTWVDSQANSIDAAGNVYGSSDGTYNGASGNFAIEWTPSGSVTWAAPQSGAWTTPTNFSPAFIPSPTISANFNTGSSTPYTVSLSAPSLANDFNVQGDAVTLNLAGNSLTVAGALVVTNNGSLTLSGGGTLSATSLSLSGNSTLDLTQNNTLVINYGSTADPSATIRGYLKSAYNGGVWTAPGLTSSAVRAEVANARVNGGGVWSIGYADGGRDPQQTIALGNQIVVRPALAGDANLDGFVTFIDLGIVAQNLGTINSDWEHGDFNYDGTTNFLDIGLLAQNLNYTILNTPLDEIIPNPSAALTAQWNLAVAEIGANSTQPADLPEPGVVGVMAIGAGGMLARRRR